QGVDGAVPDRPARRLLKVPGGVYFLHAVAEVAVGLPAVPIKHAFRAADGPARYADLAGEYCFPHAAERGGGHLAGGRYQLHAVFRRLIYHSRSLFSGKAHGLVEMYVLACAYGLHALLKMHAYWRRQGHEL